MQQTRLTGFCSQLVRVKLGQDSVLTQLLESARTLSAIDTDCDVSTAPTPSPMKTYLKGRPIFYITCFDKNGFKATDLASMFCVNVKTIHNRLEENGMSVRES